MMIDTNSEHRFSPDTVLANLQRLSRCKRVAFGVFVLERTLPGFFQFQIETGWQGGAELRAALAHGWYVLEMGSPPTRPFTTVAICERIMPDSEVFASTYTSAAINAVEVACNFLSFLEHDDSNLLIEMVRSEIDTIDLFIQNNTAIEPVDPDFEDKIVGHPLMQSELRSIDGDIAFLNSADDESTNLFPQVLDRIYGRQLISASQ